MNINVNGVPTKAVEIEHSQLKKGAKIIFN